MTQPHEPRKPSEQPIRLFGRFFKSYGLGISLVISALPFVTGQWKLIPQFSGARTLLIAIASGSSFLIVGIIFSQRHAAARLFFPGLRAGKRRIAHANELRWAKLFGWLPTVLWILALASIIAYFSLVDEAEQAVAYRYAVSKDTAPPPADRCKDLRPGDRSLRLDAVVPAFGGRYDVVITCSRDTSLSYAVQFPDEQAVQAIREGAPSTSVPYAMFMGLSFLLTFGCAASAFVLTGLKDYLQRELGLSDAELILQPTAASRKQRFDVAGVPGVYGIAEYSPSASDLEPILTGPLCGWHNEEPTPARIDPVSGKVTAWQHIRADGSKRIRIECELQANLTVGELDARFRESGERIARVGGRPPD